MADFKIRVFGQEEVRQALLRLTPAQSRSLYGRALRYAMRPLVKAAREAAPVLKRRDPRRTKGALRRAVKVYRKKRQPKGQITLTLGVKRAKGAQPKTDPFYWSFVERGRKKLGHRDAQPFLAPAIARHGQQVVADFESFVSAAIERLQ